MLCRGTYAFKQRRLFRSWSTRIDRCIRCVGRHAFFLSEFHHILAAMHILDAAATNALFSMVFAASVIHLICVADTPTTAGSGADPDMVEQMVDAMEIDSRPSLTSSVSGSSGSIPILTPISPPAGQLIMSKQVVQDVVDLKEMSFCHTFAARARQILVRMAINWEISPPLDLLSPLPPISPARDMGQSSKEINIINWKRVMEREGVFQRQKGDSDREGLPRSTSYNFFCHDAREGIPLQDKGNFEVGMSGRGEIGRASCREECPV